MAKKTVTRSEAPFHPKGDSESRIIAIRVSRESKRIYVKSRTFPLILVGVLFILPWVILSCIFFGLFSKHGKIAAIDPAAPTHQDAAGPWGSLDSFDFITDPPMEFLTDDLFPKNDAEWNFGNKSQDALNALFESAGMAQDVRARLLAGADFSPSRGCIIRPTDSDILNLAPAVRERIYDELAKIPGNQRQTDPFVFQPTLLDAWLAGENLLPETVNTTRKLLYSHGAMVLLADTATLLKTIPDVAERRKLLNVLLRRATVMTKLRVTKQPTREAELADIEALTAYWGAGGRETEVRPFIESLHHNPGGMRIDVALLLPRFARDRLYMYPLPSSNPLAAHRDCHWTAFNFFNEMPDDAFCDPMKVAQAKQANYQEVSGPLRLGDIGMFFTPQESVVHSCVYIAGDLYFSKNGPSQISPWVLMRLADIQALYPAYPNLKVRHFRLERK